MDLIKRAQNLHLEKLWAIYRATNQPRPDRVLSNDSDLSAILYQLAHPEWTPPASVAPRHASVPPLPLETPQNESDNNNTSSSLSSSSSSISGGGVARPGRNSFVMRSNPQATPSLRMSGTYNAGGISPRDTRPVSPQAQRANTGTVIAARRQSSV